MSYLILGNCNDSNTTPTIPLSKSTPNPQLHYCYIETLLYSLFIFINNILYTILIRNINLINIIYNDDLCNSKWELTSSSKLITSSTKWVWERIDIWSRAKGIKSSAWWSKRISLWWLLLKLFWAIHVTSQIQWILRKRS